jgi:hypothetical protein
MSEDTNPRPAPHSQYHSYGIRYWDGHRWKYFGQAFAESQGWCEAWFDNDFRCWTTTSILSAMMKAQSFTSTMRNTVMDVVEFSDPKVIWSTHWNARSLALEETEENRKRTEI